MLADMFIYLAIKLTTTGLVRGRLEIINKVQTFIENIIYYILYLYCKQPIKTFVLFAQSGAKVLMFRATQITSTT